MLFTESVLIVPFVYDDPTLTYPLLVYNGRVTDLYGE